MEQKSPLWKTAMTYGLYLGIVVTLYSVALYVTGQMQNKALIYLPLIIYAVGIVMAQISYRDHELNGTITYGQSVGFGVAVMLFTGVVLALYNLIIFKIDPSLIDQIKIAQEEAYLSSGMAEDQIETAMEVAGKFMTPGIMAIMGLFSAVFMGTIVSLVTSIFVKKQSSQDPFEEAMEEV